ncbi:hypothetical protein PV325_009835 [Microctonus aethiopoides]|nr:hypothetical protein PV325_009835 [Microctonus aethiopoides]
MATWIWTLCYAIDMKLLLSEKSGRPSWYHMAAWICPAILTILGLSILYIPDANCHESMTLTMAVLRILPNYCATYILMAAVMIGNPLLYFSSTKDLQTAVTCSLAQVTGRERKLVQTIRMKFALINLVFYLCWIPNLINGILLWTLWFHLPIKVIISLWYIMAVTNPLQAFFNALVYQQWRRRERFRLWYRRQNHLSSRNTKQENYDEFTEITPLLMPQCEHYTPHTSINGSSSL